MCGASIGVPPFAGTLPRMHAWHHPYAARQPWRYPAPNAVDPVPAVDVAAFASEVRALGRTLRADIGQADLDHVRKMARWGRLCSVLGWLLCWFPNPLAVVLLGVGNTARWTMVAHHVLHRGYDRVPGVPVHYTQAGFARGWRRWIDWLDWIHPAAWCHEHNQLHHGHTGEYDDPDLVEHNAWLLRARRCPRPLKWLLVGVLMSTWKLSYYAPNTWWGWRQQQRARRGAGTAEHLGNAWRVLYPGERLVVPLSREVPGFWWHCVLPYAVVRFGVLPAPFLLIGTWAWGWALITLLLAELWAQVHAFLIIVPNHAGDDLYRYDTPARTRDEAILRQVLGSVNYPGGRDLPDFLMGYLNYQIEHHVWPDLPMRQYRLAAPQLRAICARHGVPYVEESVWRRFGRLWAILMGDARMRRVQTLTMRDPPVGPVG